MMNRMKNTGLVLCGLVMGLALSSPAVQAVESLKATLSTNRIFVDGQEVQIEAYAIHDNNFMKLRDVGKAVGFNVYWNAGDGTVQIETDQPYTGKAPAKADSVTPEQTEHAAIDVAAAKQDIIDRTNALRRENGVSVLTVNDKLMQAAQVRADEMAASTVYSHTRPDGRKYTTVTDCNYVGENIHRIADWALQGKTVSEAAMWSWDRSAGHRDNLLDESYAGIGVGLARGVNDSGEECWYCVQLFLRNGHDIEWVDAPAAK